MKKAVFLIIIALTVLACKNKKEEIIEQNNMIVEDVSEFYRLHDKLFFLFENDAKEIECLDTYDSLTIFLGQSLSKYDTIAPANDDIALIAAWKKFLNSYGEIIFAEYKELLHIVVKPRYLFEAEDLQKLDSLYVIIDEKQDVIDSEFFKAHDDYLMKHKIQTEE